MSGQDLRVESKQAQAEGQDKGKESKQEKKANPAQTRIEAAFGEYMEIVLDVFHQAVVKQGAQAAVSIGTIQALKSGLRLIPVETQLTKFVKVTLQGTDRWKAIHAQDVRVVPEIIRDLFSGIPLASGKDMVAVVAASTPAEGVASSLMSCLFGMAEETIRYSHLVPLSGLDTKAEAARFKLRL